MIGDFKNFFDRLNHVYLKMQLKLIIGTDELPRDYYAVYKNVTRYAYVDIVDILRINRLNDNKEGRRKLNKKKTVLTQEQFEEYRHDIVHKNEAKYGIPQGSPISAVLANVYMVTVDKAINDYVTKLNGFYMRYSDDFIVIIPYEEDYKAVFEHIRDLLDGVPDLILEPNKTQIFSVEGGHIQNIGSEILEDADCSKKDINFLGFTFNGKTITLRAKTVGKYYYRMHRKAKYAHRHCRKKILYKRYSERGSYGSEGNFFSYVRNAEKVYGDNEDIRHNLKNDMAKIRRAIQLSEE